MPQIKKRCDNNVNKGDNFRRYLKKDKSSFLTRKAKAEISRSKCEKSKAFSQPLLKLILLCLGEVTVS